MSALQRTLWLAIAAVCAATLVVVLFPSASIPSHSSGDGAEFSSARLEWEFRRLRDPATNSIPEDIFQKERAFASTLPKRDDRSAFMKGASGSGVYDWTWRGPSNIGGRTRAFACDITGEDTLLAGGVSGGMWRSSDGGMTWTRTTRPDQIPSAIALMQDTRPGKTHVWYCGTGELVGNSASGRGAYYFGDGIYKSTDNGRTWEQLSRTVSRTPQVFNTHDVIWRLGMDVSDTGKGELYAAVYGSIMRSLDGGETWGTALSGGSGNRPGYYTDVAVTSTGVIYATISSDGTRPGIWRSTNGSQWTNITPEFWPDTVKRVVIGIAPSNENSVYFLAETPSSGFRGLDFRKREHWSSFWKYTYVSGDGTGEGGSWENRTANLPSLGGARGDYNPQYSYNMHVTVRPDNENIVYIGGTNLYRSNDGFATNTMTAWIGGYKNSQPDSTVVADYSYPNHHPDQHTVFFSPTDPDVMYSGSDGGVHKTFDALADTVVWIDLNRSFATTQFYTIAIDHGTSGDTKVIGGMQDNGTWGNLLGGGNLQWQELGTSDGAFCAMVDGGEEVFVSKQEGKTYRVILNEDGTRKSWARIDPLGAKDYQFINPFTLDPSDQKIVYMPAGRDLWRNTDVTAIPMESPEMTTLNWMRLENARDDDSSEIISIGASTSSPRHRIYYGTETGRVYRMDNASAGDPIGVEVTGAGFPNGGYVNCIAVDPMDGDRAIVVFSNYGVISLFQTTDAGSTWTPIAGNLEQLSNGGGNGPSCRWVEILHRPNGTLYLVATSAGLFSTYRLDGMGTQWYQEGPTTIGNVVVDMIDARQSDGFVVVATHANGVYSTTVATVGVDDFDAASASGIQLMQNTPNPVADRTRIPFVLSVPSHTRITLHDVNGRELLRLLDERRAAGEHAVMLDLDRTEGGLPAGTYYYRLEAQGRTITRGMQIVR